MTKKNVELTPEQKIQQAQDSFYKDAEYTPSTLMPSPTRTFAVGEQVRIGALKDVFIEKVLEDGMAYVSRFMNYHRNEPTGVIGYRVDWWFNINKFSKNENVPRVMSQHRIFPAISSDIDALIAPLHRGGLVIDPRFQREYVWTEANKDALIESIFDHLDIGAFLLVRHHGYLHTGDETLRHYRTMAGEDITIKACEDYTISVVDGQQRMTTILDFVLDRRPYKGIYFSQLNWHDQHEFMNKSVQYRIINEEQTTEKEVLRMFLQSNRGVPQTPEHMAKVQQMYDSL